MPADYRYAFSTLGCAEFTLDQTLALARAHRIDAVELRALAGGVDLVDYFARIYGSPEQLAERLRDEPVKIVALQSSLKLAGGTPTDRAALLALEPWAEVAGVPWLRVFDGGHADDGEPMRTAIETMRWWREQRDAHGWRTDVLVETHDMLVTADAILEFCAEAPGTAILWDAHNTWRKGGEEPAAVWAKIHPHVRHIHVKDSVSRPSARHPFTYVLPGEGEFPMKTLRAALRANGYCGAVSLEWERLWHPYLPPLREALRAAEKRNWW